MALVVESFSTNAQSGVAPETGVLDLLVTAPTGIEVGDLLVFSYYAPAENVSSVGFTASINGSQILYKIADSSDAVAANFTITASGNGQGMAATMYRISGWTAGLLDPVFAEISATSTNFSQSNGTVTRSGYTQERPYQQVALLTVRLNDDDPDVTSYSNFFITSSDSNPTWVNSSPAIGEGGNTFSDGDNNQRRVFTTAYYAGSTDTSNITAFGYDINCLTRTITSKTDYLTLIVDPTNASADISHLAITPTVTSPTGSNSATATIDHIELTPMIENVTGKSTSDMTRWVNEAKTDTNWTNEQI